MFCSRRVQTNVRMVIGGSQITESMNVYGFNAKYNVGKSGIGYELGKSIRLEDSDVWNVGVKWGDYKINKKNS